MRGPCGDGRVGGTSGCGGTAGGALNGGSIVGSWCGSVEVDGGVESFVVKSKCVGVLALTGAAFGICGCITVARTNVGGVVNDCGCMVCRICCCASGG